MCCLLCPSSSSYQFSSLKINLLNCLVFLVSGLDCVDEEPTIDTLAQSISTKVSEYLKLDVKNIFYTVVGENINIMKTTFDSNFDLFQAFKQHGYTQK